MSVVIPQIETVPEHSGQHTYRATLTVPGETEAKNISDLLTETLDDQEVAVAAFERPDGMWDVTLHFGEPPDQAAISATISQAIGDDTAPHVTFDALEPKDWVRASLADLAPVHAGRFIVHGAHDRSRVPANKIAIEVEAALAFGTGHHGTTRGCLLLLDDVLKSRRRPQRVLDLGCGTGVLAIAAAKALKRGVLASDIDSASVAIARDNAGLNDAGHLVEIVCASGFAHPAFAAHAPFDLVLANILANPLRALANPMARHLAPGGLAILSGLLPHQARSVIAAYRAAGLMLLHHRTLDGWSSLLVQRPVGRRR